MAEVTCITCGKVMEVDDENLELYLVNYAEGDIECEECAPGEDIFATIQTLKDEPSEEEGDEESEEEG